MLLEMKLLEKKSEKMARNERQKMEKMKQKRDQTKQEVILGKWEKKIMECHVFLAILFSFLFYLLQLLECGHAGPTVGRVQLSNRYQCRNSFKRFCLFLLVKIPKLQGHDQTKVRYKTLERTNI